MTAPHERADRGDPGDSAHRAECVGVEQQTAQGLALEHLATCVASLVLSAWALGGELRVGLAAADRLEVIGDEVIGVDVGLGAGRQLLSGVGVHGGNCGAATAGLSRAGK